MKRLTLFFALILLAATAFGGFNAVTANALGNGDIVYGNDYIVTENENPVTNEKVAKESADAPVETQGVALLVIVIIAAAAYCTSLVLRLVLPKRGKKHEN